MRCNEFLRLYSDFRDGLITDASAARRVQAHLADCDRCRHYDRAIARGVNTLRAARVEPDPDTTGRLADCATPAAHTPPVPAHASIFAATIVVAAFGLIAWDALRDTSQVAAAIPAAIPTPAPTPLAPPTVVANPGVPFIRFAEFAAPDELPDRAQLSPVASSLTLYQDTSDR